MNFRPENTVSAIQDVEGGLRLQLHREDEQGNWTRGQ